MAGVKAKKATTFKKRGAKAVRALPKVVKSVKRTTPQKK